MPTNLQLKKILGLSILLMTTPSLHAQEVVTGHYGVGFGGALLGAQLPNVPGIFVRNATFSYQADRIKDEDGKTVPGVELVDILANVTSFIFAPKNRIFGAQYAAAIGIPFANLAPYTIRFAGQPITTGSGLGDIYIQPISLDWQLSEHTHTMVAYGLYTKTGRFTLGASNNVGKGFLTHVLMFGSTYKDGSQRPFNASFSCRYEIHGKQEGRDLKPGQSLAIETGLGKFLTKSINVGIIAFYWRQVRRATGAASTHVVPYRLFGVGPAIQYDYKPWALSLRFRSQYEFGARNMSEGNAYFFDIIKAFPKAL